MNPKQQPATQLDSAALEAARGHHPVSVASIAPQLQGRMCGGAAKPGQWTAVLGCRHLTLVRGAPATMWSGDNAARTARWKLEAAMAWPHRQIKRTQSCIPCSASAARDMKRKMCHTTHPSTVGHPVQSGPSSIGALSTPHLACPCSPATLS